MATTKGKKMPSKLTAKQAAKQLRVSVRQVRRTLRSLGLGTGGAQYELTQAQVKRVQKNLAA